MLTVRLFPFVNTEERVPFNVHWPFDADPAAPGVTAVRDVVPASFMRSSRFVERAYWM